MIARAGIPLAATISFLAVLLTLPSTGQTEPGAKVDGLFAKWDKAGCPRCAVAVIRR